MIAKLVGISDRLHTATHIAVRDRAFLETGNRYPDLSKVFDKTYEGHGLMVVRQALLDNLVIALARCWDPYGSDRASFPSMLRILSDETYISELVEAAASWNPGMGLERLNEEVVRQKTLVLKNIILDQLAGNNRERLDSIMQYRHIFLAYNLTLDPGDLPKYQDIFDLLDITMEATELSDLTIRGQNTSFRDMEKEFENQANAFWSVTKLG